MPDNSLTISCDQGGTSYTATINDALEAINTMRSGSDEPINNLADGTLWLDTTDAAKPIIKIRFGGVFRDLGTLDGTNWYFEVIDNSITKAKMADDAINAAEIDATIADGVEDTGKVLALSVVDNGDTTFTQSLEWTDAIADNAVTKVKMADDAIDVDELNAVAVAGDTDAGKVLTLKVVDDGATPPVFTQSLEWTDAVAADSVTNTEMADDAIDVDELNSVIDATPANDAGKVLTLNADGTGLEWSDSPSSLSSGGGGYLLHQMTSGSGEFVVPEGVTRLIVTGAGGGGTGTRVSEGFNATGGGGAGGCCVRTQVTVTAGATISWVVAASVAGKGASPSVSGNTGNSTTVSGGGVEIILGGGGSGTRTGGAGGGGSASVSGGSANTVFSGNGGGGGAQTAGGGGGSNFWGPSGFTLTGPGSTTGSGGSSSSNGIGPGAGGGGCAGTAGNCASSQNGALIIEVGVE